VNPLVFVAEVGAFGIAAGVLGALFGLGGGIFLIPALTLGFHVNIKYAIGASLVSVIATSSGSAATYVKDNLTNVRIGTFLEVATVSGALSGAYVAGFISARWLSVLFGAFLLYSAAAMTHSAVTVILRRGVSLPPAGPPDPLAVRLGLRGSYYASATGQEIPYVARRVVAGTGMMYFAGLVSGVLGIGSGIFKVIAMDILMRLPLKVSTTTSNFMIGVTAAASAGVYFTRSEINPLVAGPVALGVLIGARLGARLLVRMRTQTLRFLFVPVVVYVGVSMILRGLRL
jgi:hypothetical protein